MTTSKFCDCCGDQLNGRYVEARGRGKMGLDTGHYCKPCWKSINTSLEGDCNCELRPKLKTPIHERVFRSPIYWGMMVGWLLTTALEIFGLI